MSELPEGWTTCKLEDVIEDYQAGFASGKKDVENGLKHLRMNNISVDGRLNLELLRTVPISLASKSHYLVNGDVLICTTNSAKLVGKCALFNLEGSFAFSNHLTRLRANPIFLESKYLLHHLWLLWREGDFEHRCKHWVNQSTLPKEELLSTQLALPPLNEQRRIVAKLEKLLSRVDAAQARLATIPRILKRFRQSVLAAACSGKLTANWREQNRDVESAFKLLKRVDEDRKKRVEVEVKKSKAAQEHIFKKPNYLNYDIANCEEADDLPSTWVKAPVGFLCDCIVPGRDKPKSFTGSIPWITLPDITGIEIWDSSSGLRLSKPEIEDVRARIIPTESVVMSCIGRFGISSIVKKPVVVNQQLHAFLQSAAILPRYLAYSIQTLTQYMQTLATSTTIAYLNKDNCNSLPINVPPMSEQQEIVRRVEALFKTADALEARYRTAKAHVDKLTQSILARAFRGELVTTEAELARLEGRDYEPASLLLERIRQERGANDAGKQTRRQKRAASPSLPY